MAATWQDAVWRSQMKPERPSEAGRPRLANKRAISRRRFVQGMLAGGAIAGLDLFHWPMGVARAAAGAPVLTGTHFDLTIEDVPINITGRPSVATAVNGLVPGPLLRWREGDTVTMSVTNRLKEPTSVHWHGIRDPADMDGVPGLSYPGIAPGETFTYHFPVLQHGTYWYHSHSHFQEQTGHYGPLVIEPRGKDPIEYDREYVIVLSEWTDSDPDVIFTNLKQQSSYYNYGQRTVGTFISDVRNEGLFPTISDRLEWGKMNMSPTDLSDVTGATYTFMINGSAPGANWTGIFKPRERVRLRFINGSSMTIFDVRIPNLPMTIVQADGNDVEPVKVDEFRISVAETYDAIVEPTDESAYTIFAQAFDRSGYARATLAPRMGMSGQVPPMDPRPLLTMVDMGMGNMGAGHSMGSMSGDHAGHSSGIVEMSRSDMPDMPGMPGMKMAQQAATASTETRQSMGLTPFPQPGPDVEIPPAPAFSPPPIPPKPIDLHLGPEVNSIAMMPTNRLAQPGVGLNNNGRRVLTYADLRARYRGVDPRPPDREIELHLTGNMERFIWGFNGEKFSEAQPIKVRLGERIRIILVNDSMMNHPIHLHGLWSELENGHGEFCPYKHTINVKPGERLSYLVSADTPGRWAYHCHLLYHMEAGMFRAFVVS
jgi:CopA family copper-resistance protein